MRCLLWLLAVPILVWSIEYNESSGQTRPFNLIAGAKAEWDNPFGTNISASAITVISNSKRIVAKPNPFNSLINLGWTLKSNEQASLAIYDMMGRKVACMSQSRADHFRWNAEHLSSGVYTAVVLIGHGKITQRITLMK